MYTPMVPNEDSGAWGDGMECDSVFNVKDRFLFRFPKVSPNMYIFWYTCLKSSDGPMAINLDLKESI